MDDLAIADRSTLERFASCPMQGRLTETVVHSADSIAAVGDQVHAALSELVTYYCEGFDRYPSKLELTEYLSARARESRPDVQPDVLKALEPSRWGIVNYLCNIAPKNILCYDGGEGRRSGQLAMDLETLPVRVTSEIDLLHATDSTAVVQEMDWKSGHKYFTEETIKESFQFGCVHPLLIFENFPVVECVRIAVWNTRSACRTYNVEFKRDRVDDYRLRLLTAAGEWFRFREAGGVPLDKVPAWPARDKCDRCDAVGICPAADRDIATDPAEQLAQLVLLNTKADAIKKRLSERVKETGRDIVAPDGTAFGWFNKPPSKRKPEAAVYVAGKSSDE